MRREGRPGLGDPSAQVMRQRLGHREDGSVRRTDLIELPRQLTLCILSGLRPHRLLRIPEPFDEAPPLPVVLRLPQQLLRLRIPTGRLQLRACFALHKPEPAARNPERHREHRVGCRQPELRNVLAFPDRRSALFDLGCRGFETTTLRSESLFLLRGLTETRGALRLERRFTLILRLLAQRETRILLTAILMTGLVAPLRLRLLSARPRLARRLGGPVATPQPDMREPIAGAVLRQLLVLDHGVLGGAKQALHAHLGLLLLPRDDDGVDVARLLVVIDASVDAIVPEGLFQPLHRVIDEQRLAGLAIVGLREPFLVRGEQDFAQRPILGIRPRVLRTGQRQRPRLRLLAALAVVLDP